MDEAELELALLERFLAQHKAAERDDPERRRKCSRELDLRDLLHELTGEEGASLDYETEVWHKRLTSPRLGKHSPPLKPCSDSSKSGSRHRFHLRAYFDDSGLPAADWATELRERTGRQTSRRRSKVSVELKTPRASHVLWDLLHPEISAVARERFEAGHFADAVEASLKELNQVVKSRVKASIGQEFDGADLMNRAFSLTKPILRLADLSTQSGKDEQLGYMQMFAGAMTGIRNPKAHANLEIDEARAIHHLFVASLLRYKLDEAG